MDECRRLPDGTHVASGFEFRNTFHLSPYAVADLFNPCGGRPASITPQNVDKLFDPKTGEKKFKYIVEGANVFITDDARRVLEDRGVILFKDGTMYFMLSLSTCGYGEFFINNFCCKYLPGYSVCSVNEQGRRDIQQP